MVTPRHCRFVLVLGCLMAAAVTFGCNQAQSPPAVQSASNANQAPTNTEDMVARGRYLVAFGGCNDCHSPKNYGPKGPEPDPARLLSGHREDEKVAAPFVPAAGAPWIAATNDDFTAWSGPWGVSFAANLTPDTLTGLRSGVWNEDLFIKALRTGKHMGTARDILPPMPWQDFAQLTDDDLKAIWAYLGTIPAVTNHVPDPIPPGGPSATQ